MDPVIRFIVPLLGTVLLWGGAFVGVTSIPPGDTSDEVIVQVEPASVPQVQPLRLDESDSGFSSPPQKIRTCEIQHEAIDSFGASLSGVVVDGATGEELASFSPTASAPTASVVKLFTAVAALRVLGADHRFTTRVVEGQPGEVFLVGGGDVTLTRAPGRNYYDSESSLGSLARQVVDNARPGLPITVRVDGTRYEDFPEWDSSWRSGSAALGFIAPVTAVQVDGDRDQPSVRLSPRSMNPEGRASNWFGEALRVAAPERQVVVGDPGQAPSDGRVLATVQSAPLHELIRIMLVDSDNSLAEVIAREVALAQDETTIGIAIADGVGGIAGASIRGGSGLSESTTIPHEEIARLLVDINEDESLGVVRESLPLAGETGSLRNRFRSVSGELAGRIEAKTGSIRGTRSLAGYLLADDGSELVFSLNATGAGVDNSSRDDIDRLLAEVSRCGSNLAHWESPDPK